MLAENAEKNGGRCQLAYPGEWPVITPAGNPEMRHCLGVADTVHHVLGHGVTGDDPRYLQAVCGPCNRKAGNPQTAADPAVAPLTQWA